MDKIREIKKILIKHWTCCPADTFTMKKYKKEIDEAYSAIMKIVEEEKAELEKERDEWREKCFQHIDQLSKVNQEEIEKVLSTPPISKKTNRYLWLPLVPDDLKEIVKAIVDFVQGVS